MLAGWLSAASVNRPEHRDYPTLFEKCVGSLKSPDRTSRDQTIVDKRLNVDPCMSTDGVAKEAHPKVIEIKAATLAGKKTI